MIRITYDNRFENGFNYLERVDMEEYEYNNLNITNDDDVNIMSMNNTGNGFNHGYNYSPSNLTKGNIFSTSNGNGKVHNYKKLSNGTDEMGDNTSIS